MLMNLLYNGTANHADLSVHDNLPVLIKYLDKQAVDVHRDNCTPGRSWWHDNVSGESLLETRNRPEMLMLAVTEIDEAYDARVANSADDKLTHLPGWHVELADCAIRLLDQLGAEQRRTGKQPLVTWNTLHGPVSARRCIRELQSGHIARGYGLLYIIGAISKAMDEGYRRGQIRTAQYWMTEALMRIIALAHIEQIDIFSVIEEKREFNRHRADHKTAARLAEGGKQC